VSPEDAGAASGLVSTHVQLGSSLGLSSLIALASAFSNKDEAGANFGAGELIAHQANIALLGGGILCLAALVIVLIFVLPKKHQVGD
jgi:hypothetical protein